GVRSVVNEIEVGEWRSPGELVRDQLITQRVRARLVQDAEIRSVNFNVEAREAVVYLLGYARSRAEADRAAEHAARAQGVERVVDLVRVAGETPDLPARGAFRAEACDAAGGPPLQPAAPDIDFPSRLDTPPLEGAPDAGDRPAAAPVKRPAVDGSAPAPAQEAAPGRRGESAQEAIPF
ncbi:MAG: BON domain-containing protein, partial [Oceanicaulis sp.]